MADETESASYYGVKLWLNIDQTLSEKSQRYVCWANVGLYTDWHNYIIIPYESRVESFFLSFNSQTRPDGSSHPSVHKKGRWRERKKVS